MSRTIYVSGSGEQDYAEVTLTDSRGHDLSTATITMGLSTDPGVQPTTWATPDLATYPTVGTAVVSLLITATNAPPGRYYVWADVADSPTVQPVAAVNQQLTTV